MPSSCSTILLVEDDPGHARLIIKNLQRAGVVNPILWVDNGQHAVDRLLGLPELPLPGLVLLDLNLPGLDGLQVLARLRNDLRTRALPVAILTTSDQPAEILRCHELGCSSFLRKPIANEQFADTIASIQQLLAEKPAAQIPSGLASGTTTAGSREIEHDYARRGTPTVNTTTEQPYRILYMEDDFGLARLLQKNLTRKGYQVDLAEDGESGLRQLEHQAYDLLLIDYNMPELSGLEVLVQLAQKASFPPTIMVTGNGNEKVAVEAMKLGATDYLVKDAELTYLELLPMIIAQVLEKQRLVREREEMLATIQEKEERYRKLVELSPDGIAVSVRDRIEFINPAGALLLGCDDMNLMVGTPVIDIIHPEHKEVFQKQLDLITQGRDNVPWVEGRFLRGETDQVEVEFSGIPFTYQGQWAVLLIFRDISERKLAQQRLEYLAHHDGLTGLPNRTLFFDRLYQTFLQARRYQQRFALLFIDLDRFKFVNDNLGHDVGDLLLQETAERLKEQVRSCDTIARMGGDEFTIILSRINEPDNARMVAEKIVAAIGRPFHLGGHVCSIGASIGISIFPDDGDNTEVLIKKADTAMYSAKKNGRGNARFFSAAG